MNDEIAREELAKLLYKELELMYPTSERVEQPDGSLALASWYR